MVRATSGREIRYMRIDASKENRKQILEAAVAATNLLKSWESYKRVKEKKMLYMRRLRLLMSKLRKEVSDFKRHFPDVKDEVGIPVSRGVGRKVAAPKTDIDREIDDIKRKLEKLSV